MNWKAVVAAGALVVAAGASIASGSSSSTSGTSDPATATSVGRDGNFEFTLQGINCGAAKVGTGALSQKAQGQFCVATVKVTNIGTEAQMFDASSQKALNGDVKLDADSGASIYVNENGESFIENVNPGNSITAKVVFDVPKGTNLTTLELHDSPFSGGVVVTTP